MPRRVAYRLGKRKTMKTLNEDFDMVRRGVAGIIKKAVMTGMVIGGLAGAVIALLYAPSSGKETRAKLCGTAIELQGRATGMIRETISQTKSKAQELQENALGKAAEFKRRAKELADDKLG